jgi:hypothetical protein
MPTAQALRCERTQAGVNLSGSQGVLFRSHPTRAPPRVFAVNPLQEDIDKEVASEYKNRHDYGKRHGSLKRAGTSLAAALLKIGVKALRSPEDFIRNLSRKLA